MDIFDAERIGRELMREHGLTQRGWTFDWDRAVKRFGVCKHSQRSITISRKLTLTNPESEFRSTMIHEIAHALVGGGHGHGPVWRSMHRSLGGNAKRTHDAELPQMRYLLVCSSCGYTHQRARKTTTRRACSACCVKHAHGRFDARFELEWRLNPAFKG